MKPRLYRCNGAWCCALGADLGIGDTPKAAFIACLQESLARYDFE